MPEAVLRVIATPGFPDYALLDSGHGRKLERFGRFTIDRPEPQALWRQMLWDPLESTCRHASLSIL